MDLFDECQENSVPFVLPNIGGYSSRWIEELQAFQISIPDGEMLYTRHYFDLKISDRSLEYFLENDTFSCRELKQRSLSDEELDKIRFVNIGWKRDRIKMYGKSLTLPRLTAWHGDSGKSYTYSGIKSRPSAWNKGLKFIKQEIEKVSFTKFNSVLLNWYRDGHDYLSWHADDENELGDDPEIASVNFGETRDFVIRRNNDHSQKIVIPLDHGTLLIMRGSMQNFWQHSVPKRSRVKGSRINLTFRNIKVDA
jgi:alkylated DNA repair dioxygenase AlkB